MGKNKKNIKPRVIPEQDKRICRAICFCQLTIVLSIVAIIYLTVAIYLPSYRAFHSNFYPEAVMCQTVDTQTKNNCSWASCGEWCLTKSSGFCPQMNATVRHVGTTIEMQNCTSVNFTMCPKVNNEKLQHFNCNNMTTCGTITGLFNCILGHCYNWSEKYACTFKADGSVLDAVDDNSKLNGFFNCKNSMCTKIKHAFSCDRLCAKMYFSGRNVTIFMKGESVTVAECDSMVAFNEANGSFPGKQIKPTTIWRRTDGILMTTCHTVQQFNNTIKATDCINGTVLKQQDIPRTYIDFPTFWKIAADNSKPVLYNDQKFLPKQSSLTIYKSSKLFINLEGCVNTLRDECREFFLSHGNDGDNNTAQSRYPCYYKTTGDDFVVARYDLTKVWRELLIGLSIPITMFVLSFISLCVITRIITVGDDTKMRIMSCLRGAKDEVNETQPFSMRSHKYGVTAVPQDVNDVNQPADTNNADLHSTEMIPNVDMDAKSLDKNSGLTGTSLDSIAATSN